MGFVDELKWREMLFQMTDGAEEELQNGKKVGYIGFDPTASSLTIGNYVQLRILQIFQKHGHQPIILMGGATGRIGDPSGKDKERDLLDYEQLQINLQKQKEQAMKFLDFSPESDNRALILDNYEFYKDMNALEFLRDIGKHITVNYMMSKESVKSRLETGISFTEFSYQVLQGYDYARLYKDYNCRFEMGGSDQWGNITTGIEMVRRLHGGKAHAVTTPLLTKKDGSKFGKSTSGNIWLDPEMTSPYRFYQFWLNADDADLPTFIKYFSRRSKEDIFKTLENLESDPMGVKRDFAFEMCCDIHGEENAESARAVSTLIFDRRSQREDLLKLNESDFKTIKSEIKSYSDSREMPIGILDLLCSATDICKSNGEARRAIKNNAISVNKNKITSHEELIKADELVLGKYLMVENGKKNKYLIEISS